MAASSAYGRHEKVYPTQSEKLEIAAFAAAVGVSKSGVLMLAFNEWKKSQPEDLIGKVKGMMREPEILHPDNFKRKRNLK